MRLAEGQTALVTGASRGLGVEIARRLAQRGLDLVLAARSGAELQAVAADLRAATGRTVTVFEADMAHPAAIMDLAQRVEALGGVDVLVNNAGVESTLSFDRRTPDEISQTVAINLTAPMLLTRALLPGMLRRGRGHIVNISSVAGLLATPFNEPYSATKFGLVGFTRALRLTARSLGWPVSASAVCPGFIGGAGLFHALQRDYGVSAEGLGVSPLEGVGSAVIQAIEDDLADTIVAQSDLRPLAVLAITDPGTFEAGFLQSPGVAMFRAVAQMRSGDVATPEGLVA
jgi:short-subunit dehydrogenase